MDFVAPFVLAAHMLMSPVAAPSPGAELAELGGRAAMAPGAALEPTAKTLHVYTEDQCLTGVDLPPSGSFRFSLMPGSYWLTLNVFGVEVSAEHIVLPPASVWHDWQVPGHGELSPEREADAPPHSAESPAV